MRSEALAGIVQHIPEDTFAPNVLVCGLSVKAKLHIAQMPVVWNALRDTSSLSGAAGAKKIWDAACQCVRFWVVLSQSQSGE